MFTPASTWEGLPYLFSPVSNSSLVLYGAMALGVIHLNTGMAVSFYLKAKRGNLKDGLFEEAAFVNRIFDENILKLFSSDPYISAQKIKLTGISADS